MLGGGTEMTRLERSWPPVHADPFASSYPDETLEPAIAPRDLDTDYLRIPAGAVAGIKQTARGYQAGAW